VSAENGKNGTPDTLAGPRPEPLRFYGTTWVRHDNGYAVRRVGLAAGSLAVAAAACFVLRVVSLLMIVMFAVCSALAFRHTWSGFTSRPDPDRQASLRGLLAIGFVGSLLAYFLRTFTEAPGEKLHRAEYEKARAEYEKRASRRTGDPSKKKRRK
jgi:ABC-type multidrug transport system fused ATPase/permease subunit